MTTATKSLVDRFTNAKKDSNGWKVRALEQELQYLLEHDLKDNKSSFGLNDSAIKKLAEFRENFDWEESYRVKYFWEVTTEPFYTTSDEVSKEEMISLMNDEENYPSIQDIAEKNEYYRDDFEYEIEWVNYTQPHIYVSNLRLKENTKGETEFKSEVGCLISKFLSNYDSLCEETIKDLLTDIANNFIVAKGGEPESKED